jgi:hypothetical protein
MWSQSLSLCSYDWGDNAAKRAKCILAHLAMPVPRSWWEHALEAGSVGSTYATILCDLQMELSNALNPDEPINLGLLVALAFIDDEKAERSLDRFGYMDSRHTPDEYLARAKEILAERPDLVRLGTLIEKTAEQAAQEAGSSD